MIFGTFAAQKLAGLDDAELGQLEALLDAPDQEVFSWLKGEVPVPATYDTPVFARLRALCRRKDPTWNV